MITNETDVTGWRCACDWRKQVRDGKGKLGYVSGICSFIRCSGQDSNEQKWNVKLCTEGLGLKSGLPSNNRKPIMDHMIETIKVAIMASRTHPDLDTPLHAIFQGHTRRSPT
jgi:hypothetical protein